MSTTSKANKVKKAENIQAITLTEAFFYWLKLGFISFGGPAGQIAIMHQDLVEKKHWISEKRFLHALNYCMVLPGPEAQQLAVYIGWLMHRTWGGIIAGSLFVLPSFFILTGLAWLYMAYGTIPAVAGALYGIKPAVVAIVLFAAYRIGSRTLKNHVLYLIATSAFIAIFVFKLPFPAIILSAAVFGHMGGRYTPIYFKLGGGHSASDKHYGRAVIDDDTPTPAHARFSWLKLIRIAFIGITIWLLGMAGLIFHFGWDAAFTQMAWFFTKAALMTFGGAYAVLPYVYQGAVEHYHWLNPAQMMDGLALGETTPGPLIMVVTFVGFVGGWIHQTLGFNTAFSSAFIAATVVTFFTFIPSFIFIFMGGPFIESTHGNLKLTAPLTAITAAVVGVILNLALFFASHVIFPSGLMTQVDWLALIITAVASIAVFKFKLNTITVILMCASMGILAIFFA